MSRWTAFQTAVLSPLTCPQMAVRERPAPSFISSITRSSMTAVRALAFDCPLSVSALVSEITVSSSEQNDGVGQINLAITRLDQTTQQNASMVEQTAAAAERLRQQSDELVAAMAVFRVSAQSAHR